MGKHTSSHSVETIVGASGSAHKFDSAKQVEELAGNDSSVAVKVENTGVQACKSRVAKIKKHKRGLETQLNDVEDIVAELAERKSSDSSLVAKLEEGENCVASLRVFVKDTRALIVRLEKAENAAEQTSALTWLARTWMDPRSS